MSGGGGSGDTTVTQKLSPEQRALFAVALPRIIQFLERFGGPAPAIDFNTILGGLLPSEPSSGITHPLFPGGNGGGGPGQGPGPTGGGGSTGPQGSGGAGGGTGGGPADPGGSSGGAASTSALGLDSLAPIETGGGGDALASFLALLAQGKSPPVAAPQPDFGALIGPLLSGIGSRR